MHTRRRGNRLLGLTFGTGLLVLLAGLVLLAVVPLSRDVAWTNTWASMLGTGVAIVGAVLTLVTWWLRQRAAAGQPDRSDQVARAAQELQVAVREQWRKEAEARSLGDPDPMPVRWRLSDPEVMDHDKHIGPVPLLFAGRSDRIPALTDQFRKLRRRRLVIVGGPGSGKTTLAVQLVLQLLTDWQPGEPVPVLLSLASWDPHTQPRVQDWLASQLAQTYPDLRVFGTDAAQKLADQGRLLPVLDGLDEIPADRRGAVIEALNASLHPDTGLIVTSRTTEYTETVHTCDVLTAAAVIQPEPLTSDDAATYLKDRLPRQPDESWQAVLTALRDGTAGPLADVVTSPLGLWLLRTVHIEGRRDPKPLIDSGHYPDAAAVQRHLLEELIPAAVRSRPPLPRGQASLRPQRHHAPDQVRRWLTTLAIELRDAQTLDWRWWQLARHTFPTRLIGLVAGLLVGLAVALVVGLLGGLGGLVVGLLGGLDGLVVGLLGGLDGLLGGSLGGLRGPLFGLLGGSLGGLRGPLFGLLGGSLGGLGGLMFGLAFGLAFGLGGVGRCDAPAHLELGLHARARALAPKLIHVLAVVLAVGLMGGLGGLLLGLVYGLIHGLVVALVVGLLGGLGGLMFGLAFGLGGVGRCDAPAHLELGLHARARALAPKLVHVLAVVLAVGLVGGLGGLLLGLVYGMVSGMAYGMVNGLAYGMVSWLGGVVYGVVYGLVGGLLGGLGGLLLGLLGGLGVLLLGLVYGRVYELGGVTRCDAPAHLELRLHDRARALAPKLILVLAVGLLGGMVYGLLGGLGGLLLGLVFQLIRLAASPSMARRRASSPADSQRGDRRLTVLATSMFGLVAGLGFGLVAGLGFGRFGLVVGLVVGLMVGLLFGLLFGPALTRTCWATFVVASLWLGGRRRLPYRLMGFLDDAYRLGLLRIVGPVYQFRHAALQDHLAPPREIMPAVAATQLTSSR